MSFTLVKKLTASEASAAILLAAGSSRRFGRANKLLAKIDGQPLLWQALDAMAGSHARPLIVVTGHQGRRLRVSIRLWQGAQRHPVSIRCVHNLAHRQGVGTTLARGVAAVPGHCAGTLVVLGDLPGLRAQALDAVLALSGEGFGAVAPTRDGRPAHPVWLARALFGPVSALGGDSGARALLRGRSDTLRPELPVACADDLDRRVDWQRLRRRAAGPIQRRSGLGRMDPGSLSGLGDRRQGLAL